MAFIGFRSVEAASATLNHFNNTFIDTSKIAVEFALPVRRPSFAAAPRPSTRCADAACHVTARL